VHPLRFDIVFRNRNQNSGIRPLGLAADGEPLDDGAVDSDLDFVLVVHAADRVADLIALETKLEGVLAI